MRKMFIAIAASLLVTVGEAGVLKQATANNLQASSKVYTINWFGPVTEISSESFYILSPGTTQNQVEEAAATVKPPTPHRISNEEQADLDQEMNIFETFIFQREEQKIRQTSIQPQTTQKIDHSPKVQQTSVKSITSIYHQISSQNSDETISSDQKAEEKSKKNYKHHQSEEDQDYQEYNEGHSGDEESNEEESEKEYESEDESEDAERCEDEEHNDKEEDDDEKYHKKALKKYSKKHHSKNKKECHDLEEESEEDEVEEEIDDQMYDKDEEIDKDEEESEDEDFKYKQKEEKKNYPQILTRQPKIRQHQAYKATLTSFLGFQTMRYVAEDMQTGSSDHKKNYKEKIKRHSKKHDQEYFDWNTNIYTGCLAGTFMNPNIQKCQICPEGCASCYYNFAQQSVECLSCASGSVLDTSNKICRQPCSSPTPNYNSTLQTCIGCPSQTTFDQYQGGCVQCPTNCSTCSLNPSTNRTTCQSCLNGWMIDELAQLCKPRCPANQQYDFAQSKCIQCPTGSAVNTTTQVCQACPTNCTSCLFNTTTNSMQCQSCIAGQELNSLTRTCRVSCNSSQYYSSSTNQCMSCLADQYFNSNTMRCHSCATNCSSCAFNNRTFLAECLSCASGSVLDTSQFKCKTICSQGQYFDWSTNLCTGCSAGLFMNPNIEQCQICPNGCSSCSYNYAQQSVECQSCNSNTLVLDFSQKICRDKCNLTAYYNWDQLSCVSCDDGQFLEPQSQSCQSCPSNCQTCFFNSSGQTECTFCAEQFTLQRKTCIEVCNSTAYYDWSVGSCITCPDGEWLNPNTLQCEFCTLGCYQCEVNDFNSHTSQCLECLPTLILDKEKCRKPCKANQFYDWNIDDCANCDNCTYPCTQCSDFQKRTSCDEMLTFSESDGVCINKCNSTTQIWNTVTKQCDSLRKFNLTVTGASKRVWRCRNTTISTVGSGFTSSETPQFTWSFEIVQGGWNKNNWLADINSLLATANTKNALQIMISSALTEKVTDNTTIKFIVTLNLNGQTTTNSTYLIVDPYVYLTIGNYSKSYSVWSADGLALYPAFYYPECPVFKGPQAIPANVSIGCSLYDQKSNLIKALPYCQILKTELTPGHFYFIKYYYAPNPLQTGTTAGLRDTISVHAYAQLPACKIANQTQISDTLYLQPTVINGKSTFVFKWSCISLTAGGVCGISSTTQNKPDLRFPATSLTQGAVYNFTMNMWENTVFQGACSARVEVVNSTQIVQSSSPAITSFIQIDMPLLQSEQNLKLEKTVNQGVDYDTQSTKMSFSFPPHILILPL